MFLYENRMHAFEIKLSSLGITKIFPADSVKISLYNPLNSEVHVSRSNCVLGGAIKPETISKYLDCYHVVLIQSAKYFPKKAPRFSKMF
jgi:hypothetical protein